MSGNFALTHTHTLFSLFPTLLLWLYAAPRGREKENEILYVFNPFINSQSMLTSFDRILRVFRSLAHCSVELRALSCLNGTLSCFNVSSILSCCFCVSYLFIYYFWFSFEPFARFDCRLKKKPYEKQNLSSARCYFVFIYIKLLLTYSSPFVH